MTQIKEFSYWYHSEHKYQSIQDAVNAWLAKYPEIKVIDAKFEDDPSFFKGTLHKAYLTVETPTPITEHFQTM